MICSVLSRGSSRNSGVVVVDFVVAADFVVVVDNVAVVVDCIAVVVEDFVGVVFDFVLIAYDVVVHFVVAVFAVVIDIIVVDFVAVGFDVAVVVRVDWVVVVVDFVVVVNFNVDEKVENKNSFLVAFSPWLHLVVKIVQRFRRQLRILTSTDAGENDLSAEETKIDRNK